MNKGYTLLWRGWFLFTVIVGGICLYHLASIGETSLNAVFLGYSVSRLIMMGGLLVCILAGILAAISNNRVYSFLFRNKRILRAILTVLFFIISLTWIFGKYISSESFQPYFSRIQPLLIYGMVVSVTGALLLFLPEKKSNKIGSERISIRKIALIFFLIFCGIYLLIRLTGIGIKPDEMDWQPNGMAIQYWEIWLSLWISLAATILLYVLRAGKKPKLTTGILFMVVWLGSAVLWVTIPSMEVLNHSYFMEITEPNNIPYPASDSAYYGLWAESVLAGLGFKTTVTTRPFLICGIAFFESLTNRDILKTIDCLTVTLALIPAFLYLLGKRLHSHGAGLLAAGMAAMREYNTIMLAPHYMVSSSKMWLSDLPAMLCLIAALCAAAAWFREPKSIKRMILTGCLAGFSVVVRSQLIILIPFLPLLFILQKGIPLKKRFAFAAGAVAAAVLILAPWLIRSKTITGEFILDEPGIHTTELARRWSDDIENVVERMEGETDAEYADRNTKHMVSFLFEKPSYVLNFISSHFFANELCALTALPFGTDPELTVHNVTDTAFHDVEGRMTKTGNIPALLIFFAFISLGLSASWKRCGWAGLLPLLICSLYHFITASGRYSGWRFALPADWFCYFYFAIGVFEIIYQTADTLNGKLAGTLSISKYAAANRPQQKTAAAGIFLLFLILGTIPAVVGQIVPQQVFLSDTEENADRLENLLSQDTAAGKSLTSLLADPAKSIHNGRIIYPRFFYKGQGLASGHPWTAYKIRDYSRLGFVLLNEENHDVILPLEKSPDFIPNAADVYVIGTEFEDYFLADAVIIPSSDQNAAPRILITDNKQE